MSIQSHNRVQNEHQQQNRTHYSRGERRSHVQDKLDKLKDRIGGVESYQQYTTEYFNDLNGRVCFFFQAYYNQQQVVIENVNKHTAEIEGLRKKLSEANTEISSLKQTIESVEKSLEAIRSNKK